MRLKTNNSLSSSLIIVLAVVIAVGTFFVWRSFALEGNKKDVRLIEHLKINRGNRQPENLNPEKDFHAAN